MPSQFQNALSALKEKNTGEFNRKYGTMLNRRLPMIKSPSQFELAREALRSESPVEFNEKYGFSPKGGKRRKTRKSKKSRRATRRRR